MSGWELAAPLIQNLSNQYGTGASLRHDLQSEEVNQRRALNAADITSRVDAAKAAGLHPLAALGVNIGASSMNVSGTPTDDVSGAVRNYLTSREISQQKGIFDSQERLRNAQISEMEGNARRSNAEADLAEQQAQAGAAALAAQPGNAPLVNLSGNEVVRGIPGQPSDAGGVNPAQEYYAIEDAYGKTRYVKLPSAKLGQVMENSGEIASTIMSAPYVADYMTQKYLQTPREWVQDNVPKWMLKSKGTRNLGSKYLGQYPPQVLRHYK